MVLEKLTWLDSYFNCSCFVFLRLCPPDRLRITLQWPCWAGEFAYQDSVHIMRVCSESGFLSTGHALKSTRYIVLVTECISTDWLHRMLLPVLVTLRWLTHCCATVGVAEVRGFSPRLSPAFYLVDYEMRALKWHYLKRRRLFVYEGTSVGLEIPLR